MFYYVLAFVTLLTLLNILVSFTKPSVVIFDFTGIEYIVLLYCFSFIHNSFSFSYFCVFFHQHFQLYLSLSVVIVYSWVIE